jgi:hypothetical protein
MIAAWLVVMLQRLHIKTRLRGRRYGLLYSTQNGCFGSSGVVPLGP